MHIFDIFIPILINPLINILLFFYHLAEIIHLPGPLGWSILLLTVTVRLAVSPLVRAQLLHQKRLLELKPQLAEIKKKHGQDPKKHREEQQKFYKEQGINPAAGCLPLLVQLPILIGLYQVFLNLFNNSSGALAHVNSVAYFPWLHLNHLDETFLGINLAYSPAHYGLITPFILIPIFTGLLQLILAQMTTPPKTPKATAKEQSFEEALASSQGSMSYLFALMIGYLAFSFPVGLALYWNVANIFAIIQQYLILGLGGLARWLPKSKNLLK
jgi:YidC/Oxa1 family membrane protein insertase